MPISSRIGSVPPNSVGSTELQDTAVTPGSYTNTDLTVDADGRITAAANGSGSGVSAVEDKTSDGSITGTINGINTVFTLSATPVSGKIFLALRGLVLESVTHYTLVGTTLTLTSAPITGDYLSAYYVT